MGYGHFLSKEKRILAGAANGLSSFSAPLAIVFGPVGARCASGDFRRKSIGSKKTVQKGG
jgi:hypothetical protein